MRTITETEYQVGEIKKTYRYITDHGSRIWRVVQWVALAEVTGMALLMLTLIGVAVAKRHGWL